MRQDITITVMCILILAMAFLMAGMAQDIELIKRELVELGRMVD